MCLLGKYKSLSENAFCTLIRYFFRYHPSKLEYEAWARTIAAVTPTSGPNIYITWSVKRTGEICGRHNKRSKILCGAVQNVLSSSLHYSTQRSCWQNVLIASVQWCDQMQFRKSENAWILSTLPPWHMLKLKHETTHHWTGAIRRVRQQDCWLEECRELDSTLWTAPQIILDRLSCWPQILPDRLSDQAM